MINRQLIKKIRVEVEENLKEIGKRYNIKFTAGNCTYSDEHFTLKLNGATISNSGEVQSKEALDFKAYAELFGFKPDDLGKIFNVVGVKYKIIGLKLRAHNLPIIVQRVDTGERYKMSAHAVFARV